MALGGLLMVYGASHAAYIAGVSLLSLAVMFLTPCFRTFMAQLDVTGGVVAMSAAFYTLGFGAAPLLVGVDRVDGRELRGRGVDGERCLRGERRTGVYRAIHTRCALPRRRTGRVRLIMPAGPQSPMSLIRKLKLNQLMVFERVLGTRSLLRAANEMSLTQPAVTKMIHELESSFAGTLFERSNRGVVPTELALVLGRRVKSLMAELRCMVDELNDLRFGTSGHVIVGTPDFRIGAAAAERHREGQGAPAERAHHCEGRDAGAAVPALATGDLDVVVGRLPERELPIANAFPLTHEALFEESLCVVVGKGYGPAAARVEHLSELVDFPWILPTADSPARLAAENLFRAAGLPLPNDIVESLSILTNIGLLLDTPRVALMPSTAARQFSDAGLLRILDLPETGAFGTVGFSVRSNKEQSAACRAFVECLRESAAVNSGTAAAESHA